jgi:predicted helicase
VPQDIILRREYEEYWKLTDVMPHYGAGIITSRDHFVIDFEDAPLLKRMELFHDGTIPDDWIRTHLEVKDNSMWSMAEARRDFRKHPIRKELIVDLLYRPFDTRRIYFETNVVFNMRIQVMRHMLAGRNLGLLTARSNKSSTPDHFFCSKLIAETKCGESTTQSSFFPLFLFPSGRELSLGTEQQVNLSPAFLVAAKHIISGKGESAANAEDIFHYAYAVLHSPGYRSRYAEFLKIDFPRLPLTGNLELFHALARFGGELTALHLLESPTLESPITQFIGSSNPAVGRVAWSNHTVWLNAPPCKSGATQQPGTCGFQGVPEAVWNFHIGGYQVCEKWLKDRKGRTLTDDDIAHYHKIIVAISETIRLMTEIDEVIDHHGGWPGAFQTETANNKPSDNQPIQPDMFQG